MSGLFDAPDRTGLGLVLVLVGCFLMANGILFRDPRLAVEQRLRRSAMPLRTIREMVFHRVQMGLGFAFLIGGFALQLWDHAAPVRPPPSGSTALWAGAVVVLVVALEGLGWWWSLFTTRRNVRRWLLDHRGSLESDANLAREVGELYGIASHADDTVSSYAARLRRALDLAPPARPPLVLEEPELVAEESE